MTRLLVDGNGVAVRTWWANPSGVPARFQAAVRRAMPTGGAEVVVCWDSRASWRRDLFPAYKGNRGPKPAALVQALEECKRIYPGWEAEGFEADDVIATLARDYEMLMRVGLECIDGAAVLVLSDDKDLLQLAGSAVRWCTTRGVQQMRVIAVNSQGEVYDTPEAVAKKMGVPPDRIRHLLSWMGDAADGLPGVPGYGPVRAKKKALAGEIGNPLTFELTELADVPREMLRRVS